MKKNLKNTCAKALSAALALGMVVSASPASYADAAKKTPKLSVSKATITVGKTKKVTVKKVKAKKVTWTVNKKGKKIVKLAKKSKKGVTIKALKKGTATVTAKIKVGKKTYKKTVKVTVKAKAVPAPATKSPVVPTPTPKGSTNVTPTPPGSSSVTPTPGTSATPGNTPTADPGDARPTYDPATSYKADFPEITISEYNEAPLTYGNTGCRDNLVWDEENHTVKVTSMQQYNGGLALCLDPVEQMGVDVSGYKYIAVTYECDKEMMVKLYDSDITQTPGHTYTQLIQKYTGTDNIKDGVHTVYVDIQEDAAMLEDVGSIIVNAKNDDPDVDEDGNKTQKPADITIHSIKFTNTTNEDTSKGEVTVTVDPAKAEVASGSSVELTATAEAKGCEVAKYEWSVADQTVASVSGSGAKVSLNGLKLGTTTVRVKVTTNTGISDEAVCAVSVTDDALKPSADGSVTISAANLYCTGCLVKENGSTEAADPVFNEDGSVTFTSTNQYSGGGIALYLNPDHSATNLAEYDAVEIVYASPETADKENDKVKVAFFVPEKPNNYMNSTTVCNTADYNTTLNGTQEQKATVDLTAEKWADRGDAYAISITFNAYEYGDYETDDGKKWCTMTIKSIKLIKSEA